MVLGSLAAPIQKLDVASRNAKDDDNAVTRSAEASGTKGLASDVSFEALVHEEDKQHAGVSVLPADEVLHDASGANVPEDDDARLPALDPEAAFQNEADPLDTRTPYATKTNANRFDQHTFEPVIADQPIQEADQPPADIGPAPDAEVLHALESERLIDLQLQSSQIPRNADTDITDRAVESIDQPPVHTNSLQPDQDPAFAVNVPKEAAAKLDEAKVGSKATVDVPVPEAKASGRAVAAERQTTQPAHTGPLEQVQKPEAQRTDGLHTTLAGRTPADGPHRTFEGQNPAGTTAFVATETVWQDQTREVPAPSTGSSLLSAPGNAPATRQQHATPLPNSVSMGGVRGVDGTLDQRSTPLEVPRQAVDPQTNNTELTARADIASAKPEAHRNASSAVLWQAMIADSKSENGHRPGFDASALTGAQHAMSSNIDVAGLHRAPQTPFASTADNRSYVFQQIATAMRASGDRTTELHLSPAELGRVRISLSSGEANMVVSVTAERAETLDLMRRNIDQLAQEFRSFGYDASDFVFAQDHPGQSGSETADGDPKGPAGETQDLTDATQTHTPTHQAMSVSLDRVDLRL